MNIVKVLVEGYAYTDNDGNVIASPTTTLVESNNKKFIVDPGTNTEKLVSALKENNLTAKDLQFIYLTHWHPDHFLNIKLFPELDIIDGTTIWKGDKEIEHGGVLPEMDVQILKTPGHSPESTSLLINTESGNICICADVFWWENGKQNDYTYESYINLEDPFVDNEQELINSRILVLKNSDIVIPGHGRMFKVRKQ